MSQSEKVGLHPHNSQGRELFNSFVFDMGLMELQLKGYQFTWVSDPRNGFVTKEKLDKVLVK
ncbi:hypothetical protein SESBI_03331 [Sesbania bispinosa]|nr:hypothetical protein SESBI_03331 [Sesbania bispinosa]